MVVLGPYFRSHADARFSRQWTNVFDQDDGRATVTECDAVMAMPERMDRPSQTGVANCRKFCDSCNRDRTDRTDEAFDGATSTDPL